MTQSTPHTSSSHCSDSSSNAAQHMPNTGMIVGQIPWPQPAYIPHPGYVLAYPCYPYGVPPIEVHIVAPIYAPVAPSPSVGAGVAHHAFQAQQKINVADPPTGVHQHHGPGLATHSAASSLPQASSVSVGQKRVAEDPQGRDAKRTKICSGDIKSDPLFVSFLLIL